MSDLTMKYFVLKPKGKDGNDAYARASRMAMLEYARRIRRVNPELCEQLKEWVKKTDIPSDAMLKMGKILVRQDKEHYKM